MKKMGNWLADSYAELTSKFATKGDYFNSFSRVLSNFRPISPTPQNKDIAALGPEKQQGSQADPEAKAKAALDQAAGSFSVETLSGPKSHK